ncbi:hypothetical protein PoB_006086200 [Plakobranchus ocellatus]|uniref:Uncharacterized protein n=1 Tax=Plakobranchus ocellatus TaxID=259542 RepID=A0AAV4CR50_9GAST|nr:hypothetical protein PoB_006086200 [Plakobranchus ocellatus]
MKLFDEFLLINQAEAPKIHILRQSLLHFAKGILTKFVKPCTVLGKLPQDVDFKTSSNVKSKQDIFIGGAARSFIRECKTLPEDRVKTFFNNAVVYYRTVASYIMEKMPLTDELLLEVVDPYKRLIDGMSNKLGLLLDRFPILMGSSSKDQILCCYHEFQAMELPSRIDKSGQRFGTGRMS